MAAQVETGHLCPITMTRAAVAALMVEPTFVAELMPNILSRKYDRQFRVVFDAIRQLMSPPTSAGRPIGFTADIE